MNPASLPMNLVIPPSSTLSRCTAVGGFSSESAAGRKKMARIAQNTIPMAVETPNSRSWGSEALRRLANPNTVVMEASTIVVTMWPTESEIQRRSPPLVRASR